MAQSGSRSSRQPGIPSGFSGPATPDMSPSFYDGTLTVESLHTTSNLSSDTQMVFGNASSNFKMI